VSPPGDGRSRPRPHRALLLYNPSARRGDRALDAAKTLKAAGIEVRLVECRDPQLASAQIACHASDVDRIVLAGGDGTLSNAAAGIIKAGLPLGILPLGTANDLARTLQIPNNLEAAAGLIVAGKTRRIDVGEVNGHLFFNVASIGLSADLAACLSPELKRRWGKLGYALAAAKVLVAGRRFHAHIIGSAGDVRVNTMQVAVGNGRHYGGGSIIHEDAMIDDGLLDLYSLESRRVWGLLLKLRAFRRGQHGTWQEVRTAKQPEFVIHTRRPRAVNADGELVTQTPAHFRVRPQAVDVFAPIGRMAVDDGGIGSVCD
jgi:diacylglycerol kinase (ATP)